MHSNVGQSPPHHQSIIDIKPLHHRRKAEGGDGVNRMLHFFSLEMGHIERGISQEVGEKLW